jgi:hypothetical protein
MTGRQRRFGNPLALHHQHLKAPVIVIPVSADGAPTEPLLNNEAEPIVTHAPVASECLWQCDVLQQAICGYNLC